MTYDENKKYFITNASALINKSVLNYYDEQLKNVHVNYDIKEILHRLYMCLASLYGNELDNMNIPDLMHDILVNSSFKFDLNEDTLISYQMMFINKLFNDYIEKKYNICKTFDLKSMKTIVYRGKYCYGPLFFDLKNEGIRGYHGSTLSEDTYQLSVMLVINSIRNDVINNIISKNNDVYNYLKENDLYTITEERKLVKEFEINSDKLKHELNDFIDSINKVYDLNLYLNVK